MLRCYLKTMNKEEVYTAWVPDAPPWSRWAKPVLFAYLDPAQSSVAITQLAGDLTRIPPSTERVALVLDLPGAEGVLAGVELAARGYRPVPLYNSIPLPFSEPPCDPVT